VPPPAAPPIGLDLTRVARVVSRAFDDALAAAGGSLPVWLVLISLKARTLKRDPVKHRPRRGVLGVYRISPNCVRLKIAVSKGLNWCTLARSARRKRISRAPSPSAQS
jgi:hypothetical protein